VYFPEQGLISLLSVMLSGVAVETAVVGSEGGVGFLEAAGAGVTFSRALVQVDLLALRVSALPTPPHSTPAPRFAEASVVTSSFSSLNHAKPWRARPITVTSNDWRGGSSNARTVRVVALSCL
jgi:hypothetical protein